MRKMVTYIVVVITIWLLFGSGTQQGIPLEKIDLFLLLGIDKDENGDLIIVTSTPFLQDNAIKHATKNIVKAKSIYEAYSKINSSIHGLSIASKVEVILIGKKVVEDLKWMGELDGIFRDPRSSTNAKVIIIDGLVMDIFKMKAPGKLIMPIYIKELMQSAIHSNVSVASTVQRLLRQFNDKGQTPSIPMLQIRKNKILVSGLAFLDSNGKYITHIPTRDVGLFRLLEREKVQGEMRVSIYYISPQKQNEEATVIIEDSKRKIDIIYKKGRIHFQIYVKINVSIIEKTNSKPIQTFEEEKQRAMDFEKQIQIQLEKRVKKMIQCIQQNQIDPLGLGIYVRSYEYSRWKDVEKSWGKELSKSSIQIHMDVNVTNTGIIRG
ncbi:Ger(X)C family germination protein [Bacillus cereus MSX-A1]|nr:Ger(X)C family germination protein [Bacillus cereus MSX-A1]